MIEQNGYRSIHPITIKRTLRHARITCIMFVAVVIVITAMRFEEENSLFYLFQRFYFLFFFLVKLFNLISDVAALSSKRQIIDCVSNISKWPTALLCMAPLLLSSIHYFICLSQSSRTEKMIRIITICYCIRILSFHI